MTPQHSVASDADPTVTYGIWLIIAAGLLVGCVWAGAQLGALVAYQHPARVSLVDAGVALVGLPDHFADPARAWPAPIHREIAGPFVYWPATLTAFGLAASAIIVVTRGRPGGRLGEGRGFESRVARRNRSGFARRHELATLTIRAPTRGRLTLGHVGHRLVAAEPQTSLAVIGPTGCGKTAGFAIPALREWAGPVIATSVKTDLLDTTLAHRAARGRVWIYDPTKTSRHPLSTWSPLAACGTWAGAMRVAAWLCEAAQPRVDTVSDGDYWYSQARKALAPYLYAAAVGGRSMRDVVRWIDQQHRAQVEQILRGHSGYETALAELLTEPEADARGRDLTHRHGEIVRDDMQEEAALADDASCASNDIEEWGYALQEVHQRRVKTAVDADLAIEYADRAAALADSKGNTGGSDPLIAAQAVWDKEPRLRGSVFATVENVIAGYADPNVADAAQLDLTSINLDEWLTGDNTIFVIAPAHEQARLRPVLTVLVQQAIRTAYETANTHGGTLRRPCLILLDEAGNIAPLRDLPTVASTARSHGISLVTIWQDLSQLKAIYADRARTVLNNHQAKLFGAGIADDSTLEYLSRLIGEQPQTNTNISGDLHGPRRSMSEHTTWRRAAPADTLRRLPRNQAVLLYNNLAPIHLELRPWYQTDQPRKSRVAFRRVRRA